MIRVALLWHMHQPFYQDLVTGEHILPWVRFHGLKDYYGMVALLREFPTVRATFNLVPSLLVQLEAFARDEARDRHLDLGLKPAEELTEDERAFCIANFFHAQRTRMIDPYPRYAELLARRNAMNASLSAHARAAAFTVQDLRDLQVWHKLAWVDPFYLDADPRVRTLVAKGRHFSEDDKRTLRHVELELLGRVIPEYRDAAARDQVELSTSPFYHPILPLLCDTDVYLRTHPHSRMPRQRFRHPEDATEQLARAVAYHERLFGTPPVGLWPSEGSVSDEMLPLVAEAGFQWLATDEEILARSTGRPLARDSAGRLDEPERLYQPYLLGSGEAGPLSVLFRDHALSDLIGFTYASWAPEAAADDFIQRLLDEGRRAATRGDTADVVIPVILDGENAWEHYEGGGRPFLRALYGRLASHPDIRTVTMSEAATGATSRLPHVHPGSWINGDFYIWIGHPDDHRAWGQLAEARQAYDQATGHVGASERRRALEELLIAEGSDWFWWYGDDHSSEHDLEFDDLFRRHVRNVYRALGLSIPEELFVTNITTKPMRVDVDAPSGFVTPTLDGELTSYFEWIGSGVYDVPQVAGSMHQVSGRGALVSSIRFGFDLESLYVRVDTARPVSDLMAAGLEVSVKFLTPGGLRLSVRRSGEALQCGLWDRAGNGRWTLRPASGARAAAGSVLEASASFAELGVKAGDPVAFFVAVFDGDAEVDHQPSLQAIELTVPGREFAGRHWTA